MPVVESSPPPRASGYGTLACPAYERVRQSPRPARVHLLLHLPIRPRSGIRVVERCTAPRHQAQSIRWYSIGEREVGRLSSCQVCRGTSSPTSVNFSRFSSISQPASSHRPYEQRSTRKPTGPAATQYQLAGEELFPIIGPTATCRVPTVGSWRIIPRQRPPFSMERNYPTESAEASLRRRTHPTSGLVLRCALARAGEVTVLASTLLPATSVTRPIFLADSSSTTPDRPFRPSARWSA